MKFRMLEIIYGGLAELVYGAGLESQSARKGTIRSNRIPASNVE